jgi:hypothetical protein
MTDKEPRGEAAQGKQVGRAGQKQGTPAEMTQREREEHERRERQQTGKQQQQMQQQQPKR